MKISGKFHKVYKGVRESSRNTRGGKIPSAINIDAFYTAGSNTDTGLLPTGLNTDISIGNYTAAARFLIGRRV